MIKLLLSLLFSFLFLCNSCSTTNEEKNVKFFFDLGNQYAKDGLFREALQSYQKALDQSPNSPIINKNIGVIYVKLGNYDAAISYLSSAFKKMGKNFELNFYLAESYRV